MVIDPNSGRRLYDFRQDEVELSAYSLKPYAGERPDTKQRSFDRGLHREVALGLGFRGVTGVHAVTVTWHRPSGELDRYEDEAFWRWLETAMGSGSAEAPGSVEAE